MISHLGAITAGGAMAWAAPYVIAIAATSATESAAMRNQVRPCDITPRWLGRVRISGSGAIAIWTRPVAASAAAACALVTAPTLRLRCREARQDSDRGACRDPRRDPSAVPPPPYATARRASGRP